MKILGGILAFLVLFIGLTLLFIRSPWGQEIITSKAVDYLSKKTGAEISIGRLFITFSGDLYLEDLYVSDVKGDTLLYSGSLETGIAIRPLIQSGEITVTRLEWERLVARVSRSDDSDTFNFDFLIEPFVGESNQEEVSPLLEEDTPTDFPEINLPIVSIKDIDVVYNDQWLGINASIQWDVFRLDAQTVDLNQMNFDLNEVLLREATIRYIQSKPFEPASEETEEASASLPLIALQNGTLNNVALFYESIPDGILANVNIGDFKLQLPEADLESQNVLVKLISLENSTIDLVLKTTEESSSTTSDSSAEFEWPDWNVHMHYLGFSNLDITYSFNEQLPRPGYFNPDAIAITDFNMEARTLSFKPGKVVLKLDDVRFQESSGFQLKKFGMDMLLTDQKLDISTIAIETGESKLNSAIDLSFSSITDWIVNPLAMNYSIKLNEFRTNFRELSLFDPSLRKEDWYREVSGKVLSLKGTVAGNEQRVKVNGLSASYNRDLRFAMKSGEFSNYLDVEKLSLALSESKLTGTKAAIAGFLTEDTEAYVPETYALTVQGKGSSKDFEGKVEFSSSLGDASASLVLSDKDAWIVSTELQLLEIQVGQMLDLPALEPISLQMVLDAEVNDLYESFATVSLGFEKLTWDGIDFSDLEILASMEQQDAVITVSHSADFLNMDLQLKAKVDTLKPEIQLLLDLKNLNAQYLGLTKQAVITSLKSTGNFVLDGSDFEGDLMISDAFMRIQGQRSIPMGDIQLLVAQAETKSSFKLISDFLNGEFVGNRDFAMIASALTAYMEDQLAVEKLDKDQIEDVKAKANFTFQSTPFIDQLLIANVDRIDSIRIDFDFEAQAARLNAQMQVPFIQYGGLGVDSLLVTLAGKREELNLVLSFESLETGPVAMDETKFSARLKDQEIFTQFQSSQDEDFIIFVKSHIFWEGDTLIYKMMPENFTLNKRAWEIPETNAIRYAEGFLAFESFDLTRTNQRFSITNQLEGIEEDHLALVVDNFDVNTITSFLNPDEPFLKGRANGSIVIERPLEDIGLLADFSIKDLVALDIPLGTLSLDADSQNLKEYEFGLRIKDGLIDAAIDGQLRSDDLASLLSLKVDIQSIDLKLMEILSDGELSAATGKLSGQLKASGSTDDLDYTGFLKLDQARFTVSSINAEFAFPDEQVDITRNFLEFKDFTMKDALGSNFLVNGKVFTEDYSNVGFDLTLNTKGFQLLNSTRADNDLFFGKANIDLDMKVTGPLSLPKMDVIFALNRGSEITFIVPEDQLDMQERDGVVLMVNRKDPYDIYYQRELDLYTQGAQGFDVRANIKVDPNFVFNLIVDERTGDNLKLQGEADLNMLMDSNGNISLSGKYEVKQGHYELNLFGLVNRRFLLGEGSSVTWTGDPLDANLDLTAIYNVRTSAAELMQAQLSGTDASTRGQFRQVLPFMVYLNIKGELMSPEISFRLDMPENEQGVFGGNVYAAVNQLNEKEDELTKQVFALLVLNQFFPSMGSDGSTGGSVNLARSSVSQVLSTQLNALSDKLFGNSGFSLDFDLDSFTDFQNGGPQDRTQLNVAAKQTLLDNRMVISVGGQVDVEGGNREQVNQGDALFGDVSVEYLLDERSQWRAKAFRRNQFESVIDGQLIVTGIALIFNKEFNEFAELWKRRSQESQKTPEEIKLERDAQLKEEEKE
ncbi:translocation/assembly module TamB domain-containing protein [Mongoliitalea daihaiensis]|uniref:translocation/assembly module TamB domain-containing protein n=1 Tax=Mongoliitalea daihaiensis TaxID=2782006 RepID=UPI001F1A75D8|nr:translocation/assembly module TamB domain-containing protein [Mongoliitalea daihaiensis]UJP63838.1 translocation/assembly module TamB [Mongoliitalea daihaiensis]